MTDCAPRPPDRLADLIRRSEAACSDAARLAARSDQAKTALEAARAQARAATVTHDASAPPQPNVRNASPDRHPGPPCIGGDPDGRRPAGSSPHSCRAVGLPDV